MSCGRRNDVVAMTILQLVLIALGVGVFGIACFGFGESIKVRYVRWKLREELREVQRETFSQLR